MPFIENISLIAFMLELLTIDFEATILAWWGAITSTILALSKFGNYGEIDFD